MTHLGSHKIGSTVRYAVACHGGDGNASDPSYIACTHVDPSGTATALTAPAKVNSVVGLYGGIIDTTGYAVGEHFFYIEYTVSGGINRIQVITLDVMNNDFDSVAAIAGATTAKNKSYSATSRTLNAGTEPAGTLSAAASHNDTYWDIQEQATGAGIDVEVTFYIDVDVLAPVVQFIGRYAGTNTHHVDVEAFNWETSGWEELAPTEADELDNSSTDYAKEFPLNSHHVSNSGAVVVRLLHDATSGALSTSHHLYVDKLAILASQVVVGASQASVDAIKTQLDDNTNGLTATRNLAYSASANSYAAAVDAAAIEIVVNDIHDTDLPAIKTKVDALPTTAGATLAQIEGSDTLGNHIADHVWDEVVSSGHSGAGAAGGLLYDAQQDAHNFYTNYSNTISSIYSVVQGSSRQLGQLWGLLQALGAYPSGTDLDGNLFYSGVMGFYLHHEAAQAARSHPFVGTGAITTKTGYADAVAAIDQWIRNPLYHIKASYLNSNSDSSVAASAYLNPNDSDHHVCRACGAIYHAPLGKGLTVATSLSNGVSTNTFSADDQGIIDFFNAHKDCNALALAGLRLEDTVDAINSVIGTLDTNVDNIHTDVATVDGVCDAILLAVNALPAAPDYSDILNEIAGNVTLVKKRNANRRVIVENEDGSKTDTTYDDNGSTPLIIQDITSDGTTTTRSGNEVV